MSVRRDPDAILATWLEEGPTRLPDATKRAIAVNTRTTRQSRRLRWVPWRYPIMNGATRYVVAAVAVLAVAVGGLYLLNPSGGNVGGPAPTSPALSASPSAAPSSAPPLTETYTSAIHGISVDHPAGWTVVPATQPWTGGGGNFLDLTGDFIYDPVLNDHLFLSLRSAPLGDQGANPWIANQANATECATTAPTTVDGVGGAICSTETIAYVATTDRGYVIRLYRSRDEPWIETAFDRAWFERVLATVDLRPEAAVQPTAPANPLEGTWGTGPSTCAQQNAALAKAGFTTDQLALGGWDAATCRSTKFGSSGSVRVVQFQPSGQLVQLEDGTIGWEGTYEVLDAATVRARDQGWTITYQYTIDGDTLVIDMIQDDSPAGTPEADVWADRIAQTVIYESLPFTRQ